MKQICLLLTLTLVLLCACRPSDTPQATALFQRVDTLLEESPDSALALLQEFERNSGKLPTHTSARYALYLAQATDKCEQSLLPCDSLLHIALKYYSGSELERAIALLYRGRLEIEMNQNQSAIKHLLEAKEIIKTSGGRKDVLKNILSSLGNEYFFATLYKDALETFLELYACCESDKDKSIALNSISHYYSMQNRSDSTIIILQKALAHAVASNDTDFISLSQYHLSTAFHEASLPDSALYYARQAISNNKKGKNSSLYNMHLAEVMMDSGNFEQDTVSHYLLQTLDDSLFTARASAFYHLYELEKSKQNYRSAMNYLEECFFELDSLYTSEKSTAILQLIYDYDHRIKMKDEKAKAQKRVWTIIVCALFACFLIALFYQWRINRKKQQEMRNRQLLEETKAKIESLQTTIQNNETIIVLLSEQQSTAEKDTEIKSRLIAEREKLIAKLQEEKQYLLNWLFTQSTIYKRIQTLDSQKAITQKELKALNTSEQEKLKEIIRGIYADFIKEQHSLYPRLTEDDLLYLSLQQTNLSPRAIAFCFGYTNTHPINQRKLRIKERMKAPE